MVRNRLVQFLLLPFSLLYGLGISIRNFLYRTKFLNSIGFSIPVISVGNLTVGGAGKSPHVEYLLTLLKDYVHVATLSRGYKRATKGFLEVQPHFRASQAGDEPVQFKRKFPDVGVFVNESRMFGVPQILMSRPQTQSVILDDAFQHLSVKPGLNILLSEWERPFTRDFLLPSGRLREWPSAYSRADIIIISKCPPELSQEDKESMIREIKPLSHQQIFFSYYEYAHPYSVFTKQTVDLSQRLDLLLVSGIARTDYLLDYLEPKSDNIKILEFEDHHDYSSFDIGRIDKLYNSIDSNKKIILTTEKDSIRLQDHREFFIRKQLNIFALPVKVKFHFDEGVKFDHQVKKFLLDFKA